MISDELKVDFSRNVQDFAVNKYCQIIPSPSDGFWYQVRRESVISPSETGEYITENRYKCIRRDYTAQMSEAPSVDDIRFTSRMLAQKAMTFRTHQVCKAICDPGNYPMQHVLDISTSTLVRNVGNWRYSTISRQVISRSVNFAKMTVAIALRGAVNSEDLVMVMGPDTAAEIVMSQEILYLKKDMDSEDVGEYGLPKTLYGIPVVIEKSVVVTCLIGTVATDVSFALPLGTVVVLHRPKEAVGIEGARTFGTVSIHVDADEEMRVQHGQGKLMVSDAIDVRMTCPLSGVLFQNVC